MIENSKDYNAPMHSAEHILNQTMIRLFGVERSFNNHIEKKKSKCDYHFERELTLEEISLIEAKVNEIISQKLPITSEIISKESAKNLVGEIKVNSINDEDVRIVKIGDYDTCACSGIHVTNTSEIGLFHISSTIFKPEEKTLRIIYKLD